MSSDHQASTPNRQDLLDALTRAVYESSTTAVFFHTAIAEHLGIGATEEKTILTLSGLGSLTAGEIAQHTGLTTASVTSLIDRLEKKGFVRRVRDTKDRRRVIVELDQARLTELMQIFSSLGGIFEGIFDAYTDDQLAAITDYLTRSAQYSRQAIATMQQRLEDKGEK